MAAAVGKTTADGSISGVDGVGVGLSHAARAIVSNTASCAIDLFEREGSEPIQPRTIIEVGGFYLVEAVNEPDDWYMGERGSDGVIVCWGKYGDIETALRGL